ncbi:MAG: hypothetical protein V3U29_01425 [Phycisphaeraceae bacterium]
MPKRVIYPALICYGLSLLGAALAVQDQRTVLLSPASTATSDVDPPHKPFARQLVGFAINLHHTDTLDAHRHAIDELKALGFNSVLVITPAFQTNGASVTVRLETGPGRGPSRQQLVALLGYARDRGMQTVLMPVVLFTAPRGNEWRGKIKPQRWDDWWQSYREVVDYFVGIANEAGVQIFCVGSELLTTERQTGRWVSLIAHVRRRFQGQLIYSTNWDHYHVPGFWPQLDAIAMNAYWNLVTETDPARPDPAALAERWRQIREQLLAFAAEQGRPVLLTEVGYPSLPWALQKPWNYVAPSDTAADAAAQAMGYAAFLEAWGDLIRPPTHAHAIQPVAPTHPAGVFFYEWDVYANGPEHDTRYGVQGKPALDLLRQWLRDTAPRPGAGRW